MPFGGRTCSYLRTVTRAPLDHANLLFNYGLPSRHVTYTSHARTFLVVDMNEHTHPLVVSPLLEMPSAEDTAIDGSLAHHLDAPPSGTGHCGKRGPFWATLPVTPWGDTYILFFNDRFSHREDMIAVTAAEFVGPTSLSTDTPPFGGARVASPRTTAFCSKLSHIVYELLCVQKITTSSYHPSGNGGVEHANRTMT